MKHKLIMMLIAVLNAAISFALPEPAVWLKADTGVTVESGKVTTWANQGSLKSTLDAVTATGASITVAENATFGTVLRFDGTDRFISSVSSNLGIDTGDASGLACFIVCEFASAVGAHPGLYALWDGSEASFYQSIFFNDNLKRMYAYFSSTDGNPLLFDQEPGKAGTIGKQALAVNANVGRLYGFSCGRKTDRSGSRGRKQGVTGNLYVGGDGQHSNFMGDFAEIRIYNQALTASERFQIECELASKYGYGLNADSSTAIPAAMLSGCGNAVTAFGSAPTGEKTSSVLPTSGTSGELTVSFGETPSADDNTLTVVANNGAAANADKVWCVAGATSARAMPLTLAFDAAVGSGMKNPTLYCRDSAASAWTAATVSSVSTAGGLSFVLPTGWRNGQYAVREKTADSLVAWFKADGGVTVDGSGNVTKWTNLGTYGSMLDLTLANGGAGVTVANNATYGTVLRSDGTDHFASSASSTLGVNNDSGFTYFLVCDFSPTVGEHPGLFALWDGVDASYWYSIYFNDNSRYLYSYLSSYNNDPLVFDQTSGKAGTVGKQAFAVTAYAGKQRGFLFGLSTSRQGTWGRAKTASGNLHVGGDGQHSNFAGDIAEFRFYNQSLTASGRFQVECELAGKYGYALNVDSATSIPAAMLSGYGNETSAFGSSPTVSGVRPDSAIPTSGTSGELTVSFAETPAADTNTLTVVANNGAADVADKVWCVAGALGARAIPLTLAFDATVGSGLRQPTLYFRDSSTGEWTAAGVSSVSTAGGLTFELPAGWKNGQYAVLEKIAPVPSVWFKADEGVTVNGAGQVTKWENKGSLGSVLDLGAANDAPGVTVAQNAQFGTSLRFDGTHYLQQSSNTPTWLGMRENVGGTCILVCDFGETAVSANTGMFGLYRGSDTKYAFGLSYNNRTKWFAMCAFYEYNDLQFCNIRDNICGRKLISVTLGNGYPFGCGQCAVVDGVVVSNAYYKTQVQGRWNGKVYDSGSGLLRIGRDYGDANAVFAGDIAELRVYDRPLTSSEEAEVELELAAKYGFAIPTVGPFDATAVASHQTDAVMLGAQAFRGPTVLVPMATTWSDEALDFRFLETPPAPPSQAAEGAGVKSLTYIGSDGGTPAFAPRSAASPHEDFGRTWYIASSCPAYGGVLRIACDTTDADEWKIRLYRKVNGAQGYSRVAVDPVIGDDAVTFTLDSLEAGTYRLTRTPAGLGTVIIVR